MPLSCPNCGRDVGRGDQFCDACGHFLGWGAGASGDSGDSQMIPQPAPERDQRAGVQLQIKTDLIKVAPGSTESAAFTVKNLGTQVEEFRIAVTGPGWITAAPAALSVYPGQEGAGTLQAAPPRQPSSVAGTTPFRLTATSAVHAGMSGSAAGRVDVAPYYELGAELVPTSSHGRGLTRHDITLDNRGNVPLRIGLRPVDVADGLRLGVPAFADVPPGRVIEVPVPVYGSRRWFGRPEPKAFSVTAEAPKPLGVTRLSGTRTVLPVFPRWVPAVAGLVAAAVVATVIAAIAFIKPGHLLPPPPPPTSTSTSSSSGSASASASASGSSSESASASTAPLSFQLLSAASTAEWTSMGSDGPQSTQVQPATGCQPSSSVTSASQGAVYTLTQAALEDGEVYSALETDPPAWSSGFIDGLYTLPSATPEPEVFRADVGFCVAPAADAQVLYQVIVGPQQSSPQPVNPSTQLTPVEVQVPAGTTTIELRAIYSSNGSPADLVWVNPRIEDPSAS